MKKIIPLVLLIGAMPLSAHSGTFTYSCNAVSSISCDGLFKDIVTDKFTARYHHAKWKITAYAQYAVFSNGGGAGHAFVGVVPIVRGKGGNELDLFPDRWFSRTVYTTNDVTPFKRNEELRSMLRDAAEVMMAECDANKNCDIDR